MSVAVDAEFRQRVGIMEAPREDDERDGYQRDRARIIHCSAFRRLQAKTQVMGVGEGDFHRTRHSLEVAQIGEGIRNRLYQKYDGDSTIQDWLPTSDLISTACYAHDLGHPPYGHAGEHALQEFMAEDGGFEGNAQTLRILTRLEDYTEKYGINPTKRLMLAVLKYPVSYGTFYKDNKECYAKSPPKCYYDSEAAFVSNALDLLFQGKDKERDAFLEHDQKKAKHRTLDATIMECADDIAYGVHDLEDIVGRRLINRDELQQGLQTKLGAKWEFGQGKNAVGEEDFLAQLFKGSFERKKMIGKLVHLFISSCNIRAIDLFAHPLVKYRCNVADSVAPLLKGLKKFTYVAVVKRPGVQQLERRGKRIVKSVIDELMTCPEELIPKNAWQKSEGETSIRRRVCDYVSGMTDPFCDKIYHRLFSPGIGSSTDEL